MKALFERLHSRLGDLWWYTLLLFAAQRFGDVLNVFVGLWLVPKYVPQQELGAVMPLTQVVSFVGLPLLVVAAPFMKFLNLFAARGEVGKVKALLRDVFIGVGIMALVSLVVAWVSLPFFFERMRVSVGSLGILIVLVSILGSVSSIFQNAVQGLNLFSSNIWISVIGAPLRLVVMLIAMPFRALAGYFVGQGATPSLQIVGSLWVLRKYFKKNVKAVSYWKSDGGAILRYLVPTAVLAILVTCGSSVDQLIIRHRLTDFESAGYYIISRFAEIASYLGTVFVAFLFPMVASKGAKDRASLHVLGHAFGGTLVSGGAVAALLAIFGHALLGLQPQWCEYQSLSDCMAWLAVSNTLTMASSCLSTYEGAQGRFRFLWYVIPLIVLKAVILYSLTGFSYFDGIVPASCSAWVASVNPNRLGFLIKAFIVFSGVMVLFQYIDIFCCKLKRDDAC